MLVLQEVKDWLNKTDEERDDVLEDLMNRAIETVQRELDWYFGAPRDTVEVLDGTGTAELWLRQPPSDSEVEVRTRAGVGSAWVVLDEADYELDGRGLFHASEWPRGHRNVRVAYHEGFANAPGDVVQLTLELIASKWGHEDEVGIKSERIGDYAYTRGELQEMPSWASVRAHWQRGLI